jgi:alkylated DNA repair protein alkB family protein 7
MTRLLSTLTRPAHRLARTCRSHFSTLPPDADVTASFVEHLPPEFPTPAAFGLHIMPSFLSEPEHDALVSSATALLARARFEDGHWDAVIRNYRESQALVRALPPVARAAVERALARFPVGARAPLPAAHFIELAPAGDIGAHVDSVKFSGGVVAGLCLLSDAVMELTEDPPRAAPLTPATRLLLPRRALYVLSGAARFRYAHAIPAGAIAFGGTRVVRARRISVMLRDEPPNT